MASDRRSATRVGVRTPVVIYTANSAGQLSRCRAWTDDLSDTGAKVTCEQPLEQSRLFARVMLPELKDQLIECEVAREIQSKRETLGNMFDIRRSYYGIKFVGLADPDAVHAIELLDDQVLGRA